jgi:glycosyltransferase involved in cell wall biosynthesis
VGSDEERKNLGTLLQAFARVRAGGWPGRLVLCGDNPNLLARHARTIRECALAGLVIVEGYVDEEALRRRYREAALFVFPSLYEGFGLPVLEAMASGTPVACARAASLPEIAGAAAEYFDPRDADDMARAMRRCLDDDEHAHRLAALGREQAAGFTWEAAADRMLGVFEQAAARPA